MHAVNMAADSQICVHCERRMYNAKDLLSSSQQSRAVPVDNVISAGQAANFAQEMCVRLYNFFIKK